MMLAYLRMEVLRTLRAPAFLGYTIGFPAVFYLLFTTVFDRGDDSGATYGMVSMALYGAIVAALPGFGARIALERTRGWTRQLALSPMRPVTYLGVKFMSATMLVLPAVVAILLLGRFVNHVHLPVTTWLGLAGALWLASLPFIGLGIVIGYTFRDELAQAASMVSLFVLSIIGGLWMPVRIFPHWLARIADVTPTYRAGQLGWSMIGATHVSVSGLAILLGWTVVIAALAGWRFRRAS
jgi:ABC-2 type transport system permease protein